MEAWNHQCIHPWKTSKTFLALLKKNKKTTKTTVRSIWLSNELDNSSASKIQIQIQHYQTVNITGTLCSTTGRGRDPAIAHFQIYTKIFTIGHQYRWLSCSQERPEDNDTRKGGTEKSTSGRNSSSAKSFPMSNLKWTDLKCWQEGYNCRVEKSHGKDCRSKLELKVSIRADPDKFSIPLCFLFQTRLGLFVYNLLHLWQRAHLSE